MFLYPPFPLLISGTLITYMLDCLMLPCRTLMNLLFTKSFFSGCFILAGFYFYFFDFTDISFCSVYNAVNFIKFIIKFQICYITLILEVPFSVFSLMFHIFILIMFIYFLYYLQNIQHTSTCFNVFFPPNSIIFVIYELLFIDFLPENGA